MSYVIVSGNMPDVTTKVNSLLSLGFNLHGSISVVMNTSNRLHYTQPMSNVLPNIVVKNMLLRFMSNGREENHDVIVVQNSLPLDQALKSSDRLNSQDRSRWMHCKSLSDLSKDIFVKDEQYAFNELNIEQGAHMGDVDGGRRHRTSRKKY